MRITDEERRSRLVARHRLDRSASGPEDVVRAVVALHSSDPVTPYLAAWARIPGFAVADLESALYAERTLLRMHAMRRTLFVVPAADGGLFHAAAGADVAVREHARLLGFLDGVVEDGPAVVADLGEAVLAVLGDGERTTRELGTAIPALQRKVPQGSGKWATDTAIGPRLLMLMAMQGRIVRTRPTGSWRASQYRWAGTADWLGAGGDPPEPAEARVELARRYLRSHGPATMIDLRWWTGWTVAQAKGALAALDTATVELDGGGEGLLLADDEGPPALDGPAVALLPGLDPTPMGWKERAWYLGPDPDPHYDSNGNSGPMVMAGGRAVGAWAQRPDGEVVVRLLVEVDAEVRAAIDQRARELAAWLDGVVVSARFPSPLQRELAAG